MMFLNSSGAQTKTPTQAVPTRKHRGYLQRWALHNRRGQARQQSLASQASQMRIPLAISADPRHDSG
jgi:hypothetical protein